MDKGKFGLKLTTYAVVAFALALLGQMLLCGLLVYFVLVKEEDERAARQCLTAFFTSMAFWLLLAVWGLLSLLGGALMGAVNYRVSIVFFGLFTVLGSLALIALFVFIIIGFAGAAKGREARLPIFSALTDRAFGIVRPKPQPQPYPQAYPPPAGQGYPGYYPPGQPNFAAPPQGQPPYAYPQYAPPESVYAPVEPPPAPPEAAYPLPETVYVTPEAPYSAPEPPPAPGFGPDGPGA